jgi:ABC-type amino acid transport substrate-binding protein
MRNGAIVIGLSCSALASATVAADFPDVKQRGTLRVLCVDDADSARYLSLDPDLPGFDHEVLLGFARLHEVVLELVVVEGEDLLVPALLAGHGDVIAGRPAAGNSDAVARTTEVPARVPGPARTQPHHPVGAEVDLQRQRSSSMNVRGHEEAGGRQTAERLSYALRPEDESLLTALNDYLVNLQHTATWSELVDKYFSDAETDLRQARGE